MVGSHFELGVSFRFYNQGRPRHNSSFLISYLYLERRYTQMIVHIFLEEAPATVFSSLHPENLRRSASHKEF